VRHALHEVVARCIYGVDLNPMAVELAKVSLWLEALEPGKPLNFLDAHVKHGNALVGVTPALLKKGGHPALKEKGDRTSSIPDEAFKAIEGDDKKRARFLTKLNKEQRAGQIGLFDYTEAQVKVTNTDLAKQIRRITTVVGDDIAQVRKQEAAYRELISSEVYVRARRLADAWCAAFVWPKTNDAPLAVTQEVFQRLANAKGSGAPFSTIEEIERLRELYRFFHWHLEFPEVFSVPDSSEGIDEVTGWAGGFACVLGNPPWERIKLQEQEFFAQRDTEIATARNAAERKRLIADLKADADRSVLYQEFEDAKRRAEGESHFLRNGGRYPLTGRGDINTYAVFSELDRTLVGPCGRMGVIVPTGIATDATTQYFFKDLVQKGSIAALYDFENRSGLFSAVDSRMKFCILSLAGRDLREPEASFAFFLHDPAELDDADKAFTMTPEEITLLNPNTGTCPVFRSRRDAEITLGIYRRVPVLVKEGDPNGNPWGVSFMTMFHMSNDSHLFHTREQLEKDGWTLEGNVFIKGAKRMLPLYEGRMGHQYNHRYADSSGDNEASLADLDSINYLVQPQYWITSEEFQSRRSRRSFGCESGMLGHRRVARNNDDRTCIAAVIPWGPASYGWIVSSGPGVEDIVLLEANYNSFSYDYLLRNSFSQPSIPQSTSEQVPVIFPGVVRGFFGFIKARVLELTCTAVDLISFAEDLGDHGMPFRWDQDRRSVMRAELDALFFHLYGIGRDDVDYIMETFPIVKKKDVAKYGTYRTKERILEIYDRMAEAGVSQDTPLVDGENFISELTPPPGHGPRHAPAS
jgi:hypothetical protein